MTSPIEFPEVTGQDDAYDVTLKLADDIRDAMNALYSQQAEAGDRLGNGIPNITLAALTIVWLEAVKSAWNTMGGESAIQLLRGVEGGSKETSDDMRHAAKDFLRRSGWKAANHAEN